MHGHFEPLDPRRLLAFTGTFTDVDGDAYTVKLTGNGSAVVATLDSGLSDGNNATGAIGTLTVTGTDTASRLSVAVTKALTGDGRVNLGTLNASVLRRAAMANVDVLSGAFFADIGQLALGDFADDAALEASLTSSSNNLGSRTATLRNIGDDVTLDFGEGLASVKINDSVNADFFFREGVQVLSATNDLIGRLGNADGAAFSELRAGGLFQMRASIDSNLKTISAGSIAQLGSGVFETTGSIGSIVSKSFNSGSFVARNYGTVSGVTLSGSLESTAVDPQALAIKVITFSGTIDDSSITATGPIGSISAQTWVEGFLRSRAIRSFTIRGNMQNADISFTGPLTGLAVGSFSVGGVASGGLVKIRGAAGPITLGSSLNGDPLTITDDSSNSAFKSITLTSKTVVISQINLAVGSVGTLSVAHGLVNCDLSFTTPNRVAVKTFKITGQIQFLDLTTPSTSGIDSFSARGLFNSEVTVGYITTLKFGKELSGASGGLDNGVFTLSGANAQGFALKSAELGDRVTATTFSAQAGNSGRIGSIIADSFTNLKITAPTIGSLTSRSTTGNAEGLTIRATLAPTSGYSIGTIDVRGSLLESRVAAAGSINRIIVADSDPGALPTVISAGSSMIIDSMPDTLAGFANASINQITYTRAFQTATGHGQFSGVAFVAPAIGTVQIKGRPNTTSVDDGLQLFGFGARTFGSVRLATVTGGTVQPTISTTPGDYNPFSPDANGNLIVRRYA